MKVSILQENLDKALAAAQPFSSARGHLVITQSVKLSTDGGMLKVEATDLERRFTTWIGAMVEEEGGVCVNLKRFQKFVHTLPSDRMDLTTTDQDRGAVVLDIRCGKVESAMVGVPDDDFPPAPRNDDPVLVEMEPKELALAIRRTEMAVAREESRPVLTGASFTFSPDGYEVAAADGFRLAQQVGPLLTGPDDPIQAIIPRPTLLKVGKFLNGSDEPVRIELQPEGRQVRFLIRNSKLYGEVISQTINGTFPNYQQLIPTECDWTACTDVKTLRGAVESAAVYAVDGSNIIRLWAEHEDIEAGHEEAPPLPVLRVSARSGDVEHAKRPALCTAVDGVDGEDKGRIAFNATYLHELLGAVDGPVTLEATTPSSPGVFVLPQDDTYKHVVMPMFVQW